MRSTAWVDPDHDWWTVGPGKGTCKMCGEDDTRGLISKVEDKRGVQLYCGVCGHCWWPDRA